MPVWGLAGMACVALGLVPGASFWYHGMNTVSSCTFYTEPCNDCNHCKIACLPLTGHLPEGGIATLIASEIGGEGVSVD